ncbi:diguanylate cyclase [Thiobacillus sp.]|uniref:sensor domain-containing diguanylate cyclase n=1 Tax=Thiobacillus sp. TaxID=924 RepID=UPI0025E12191|nr:diguanylate cyclase [Thiobacillus sp.]MBT9539203.1 diguanylate cyclase [Thiobacillus sp.]
MNTAEQLNISGQLPSPKGVALAVLELSRRENATLGEVARVVQTDPALSGRLIKLANTASHISRPVVSVQEAVVRQGMTSVRQLALGFSLLDQYRSGICVGFDYQAYWSHSLLMGLAMQALGARVRSAAPDELFICGLLAQVGQLALATAYPSEYSGVLAGYQADRTQSLLALEHVQLETDHTELGVVMMADWGLPKVFTEPLAHYEDPEHASFASDSRSNSLMLILRLSHLLADYGLATADARPHLAQEWIKQAEAIDITPETAGGFIDKVTASWREWGELLKIPTTALPPFEDISKGQSDISEEQLPLRIVVADGNAASRRQIMSLLVENSAHIVYPAENGNAALALAMEILPHVIIAQVKLPELDGSELCHALRATEEGRRMHILLMGDENGENQSMRTYESCADGYLPSSVDAQGLRIRLFAAQRLLQLQNNWEKDRAQLRQIAAELAVANRRLATAALTDSLTGLSNRRSAMDQLQQIWSATTRSGMPLSLIVLDIDHFKQINDTYGHAVGDIVLRETAEILRKSARQGDTVSRIGGEEFLVICPNTDIKAATQAAERLRLTLESSKIMIGRENKSITVTASFGISSKLASTADIDALVNTADLALYAAKQEGRNRFCVR